MNFADNSWSCRWIVVKFFGRDCLTNKKNIWFHKQDPGTFNRIFTITG